MLKLLKKQISKLPCFSFSTKPTNERVLTLETLKEMIAAKQIHTVNLGFPDHYGRLMGKRFDADFFLDSILKDGGHACNYLLSCDLFMDTPAEIVKWESGYGDYHMEADPKSLRHYWIDGEVIFMTNLYNEFHEKVPHAPREILRKQVEKTDNMGLQIYTASELEFYPFKKTAKTNCDDKYKNLELTAQYSEDYNLMIGDRNEEMIYAMRKALNLSGLNVETSKGEAGTSQHEINIKYSDPMTMADHHVYYKNILRHVADQHHKCITFMAKPFQDQPGSSCHIHLSLFDKKGNNLFNGNDVVLCPKRNLTASKNLIYFLGGWMKHVLDVFPIYAPFVNSYKRFVTSSWAPTNLNAWSVDNRTSPFRIVGKGQSLRIEFRIPGADVNPYLVFAASIASGLEGIEKKIEPPKIVTGNVYEDVNGIPAPKNLETAIKHFEQNEFSKQFLGEDVRRHYASIYKIESNLYNRVITDWELKRYFDQA